METCRSELAVGVVISKGFPARVETVCVVVFNLLSTLKGLWFRKGDPTSEAASVPWREQETPFITQLNGIEITK